MIDIYAPIIPYEGLGGIKLYSTMKDLRNIITGKNVVPEVIFNEWIRFNVDDFVSLEFDLFNGKLFRIGALENYKGTLFDKIYIGLPEEDLLKIEPTFVYDDFEEVYISPKCTVVETFEQKVDCISVYIPGAMTAKFGEEDW